MWTPMGLSIFVVLATLTSIITAFSTPLCNHFDLPLIAKINYPKSRGLNNTWDCVMVLKIVSPKTSPGANSRHLRVVCFRGCGRNPLFSLSPGPPVFSASGFLPSSCGLFYIHHPPLLILPTLLLTCLWWGWALGVKPRQLPSACCYSFIMHVEVSSGLFSILYSSMKILEKNIS